MRFLSLFTGVGGFDLGFERAGMTCVGQVENDRFCQRILSARWPHVARWGDVREFAPDRVQHSCGVVCGGFPCQDLSVAGKRAGLAGERSGLFWEFVRVASVLRPSFVVAENVPGLLSSEGGRDMGTVIGALADIGYCVAWRVLDSQYFGVAQRRRRVFIVGHSDPHCAAAVLFESESGAGDSPAVRETGTDVAHCLDGGTGGISGKENQRTIVQQAIRSKWAKGSSGPSGDEHHNLVVHTLRADGHDAGEDGTGRGTPIVAMPLQSPGACHGINGPGWRESGEPMFTLDSHEHGIAYSIAQNQRGELRTSTVVPALGTGGGKPGEGYPCAAIDATRVRDFARVSEALDLCRVCEEGPDGPRYKAIGNAVTFSVAEWIGRRIMAVASNS